MYNQAQQQLIDSPFTTPTIGVAAAGSGKTYTILGRVKRVLTEYNTGSVVVITFTNNSAKDVTMKLRKELSDEQMRRVIVGTFHSVIGKLIRLNATTIGLQPSFSIIDENSTDVMYRTIIENNAELFEFMSKNYYDTKTGKVLARHYSKVSNLVSTLVNTSLPSELETGKFSEDTIHRMMKAGMSVEVETDNYEEQVEFLYTIFKKSLESARETNTINYDHILFLGYLMCKHGILDKYAESLVHMFVDEFQDLNALQDEFVRAIGRNKITIVGDPLQAIYEFRGGRPELMIEHARTGKVVNLSTNYRSHRPILDCANELVKNNTLGMEYFKPMTTLKTLDETYAGVTVVLSESDLDESKFIIKKINHLIKQGVEPSEIAILVRSRMAMASLNIELQREKIQVNDTTKFADFMRSDAMVDTLNFLKVYTNPKDIYAFLGIIDKPARGIGPSAIAKIQEKATNKGLSIIEYLLSDHISELTPGLRNKVNDFVLMYKDLIENKTRTFPEAVDYILNESGYIKWIKGLKNNTSKLRNIEILQKYVQEFTKEYETYRKDYSLYDIANHFTFEMMSSTRQENKSGVVIATIHGSKGLEWDHVFIVGLEEELFPGTKIIDESDMESERRLMYVATTRARLGLTLFTSEKRLTFGERDLTESRFIKELGLNNYIKNERIR